MKAGDKLLSLTPIGLLSDAQRFPQCAFLDSIGSLEIVCVDYDLLKSVEAQRGSNAHFGDMRFNIRGRFYDQNPWNSIFNGVLTHQDGFLLKTANDDDWILTISRSMVG